MTAEVIGAVFTGITGLIAALAGLNFQRNKKLASSYSGLVHDFRVLKKEVTILRKLDLAKTRHMYAMQRAEAAGQPLPPEPPEIAALERQLIAIEAAALEEDTEITTEVAEMMTEGS